MYFVLMMLILSSVSCIFSGQVESKQTVSLSPLTEAQPVAQSHAGTVAASQTLHAPMTSPITIPSDGGPSVIHVNLYNEFSPQFTPSTNTNVNTATLTSNTNTNENVASSMATANNVIRNTMRMVQTQIAPLIPDSIKNNAASWAAHVGRNYLWYGIGSAYAFICAALIRGNFYCNNDERWARWKQQLTTEELYAIPQPQLAKDLVVEIQRRYLNAANPTDYLTPLVRFMADVDSEATYLTRYLQIARAIRRCKLMIIFPINDGKIEQVQILQQRLQFVKHIFVSWATTHNVGQFHMDSKGIPCQYSA